ncbi:response regulator transcription factor [Cohnella cellulosilytica]|uniref:Response regulator n=1 Tax=Cohnella cellulosilytica TaxID=986710 RepID=A0ABW2F446_9BACL
MRICVIDDESAVRSSVVFKLKSLSDRLEVFDVEGGLEAMDKVRRIRPHLVITDILMPDVDGLELLSRIRSELPATRVVMLSGYNEFEYARKALQNGAVNYLLKPIDPDELRELLTAIEREEKEKLAADFQNGAGQLADQGIGLELLGADEAEMWFDEWTAKRVRLTEEGGAAGEETAGRIFTFRYNGIARGFVSRCGWSEEGSFAKPEQFAAALLHEAERWETDRFYGTGTALRRLSEQEQRRETQLRQAVLQAVKDQDPDRLAARLTAYLAFVEGFSAPQVRQKCAYLMAALDEALTTKFGAAIVEEHQLAYWTSWVDRYAVWRELRDRIEAFVVGGVRALIAAEQAEPHDLVERAMRLVRRQIGGQVGLESVASSLSVHSVTLSRLFKQQTGENFVRFVVREKMKQAAKLLAETDRKAADIAEQVGYTDYRYFALLFKQAHGFTPSEYRKRTEC